MSSHARTQRLRRLAEREAVLSEQEQALLARRELLDERTRALLDTAVDVDAMLDAREAAVSARAAVLFAWVTHLDAADAARKQAISAAPVATPPEFWGELGERLSSVLSAEIGELPRDEVRAAVGRALSALGGSAPPQPEAPVEVEPM
jgi:hypothetical protein